jgi:hypothetical protein
VWWTPNSRSATLSLHIVQIMSLLTWAWYNPPPLMLVFGFVLYVLSSCPDESLRYCFRYLEVWSSLSLSLCILNFLCLPISGAHSSFTEINF